MADEYLSDAAAMSLLLLSAPSDLAQLSRDGWIKPAGPGREGRWARVELVQGYIRHLRDAAMFASTKQIAASFGVTHSRVRQIAGEGWIKPVGKDRWNRDETTAGYLKFLRNDERRSSKSAGEFRLRDAKARVVEMQLAERARDLIRYDEAETSLETVVGMVRTEMGGVAARVTRDLVMRRAIEKAINEGLTRIVERLAIEVAALKTGDGATGAVADFDA